MTKHRHNIFNCTPFAKLLKDVDKSIFPFYEQQLSVPYNVPVKQTLKPEEGTIIVRPVICFNSGRTEIQNVLLPVSETGTVVLKAHRPMRSGTQRAISAHTEHFIAGQVDITKALVCFCDKNIPNNWIAFKVVKMGKNNRCVFVEPIAGTKEELLSYYTYNKSSKTIKKEEKAVAEN